MLVASLRTCSIRKLQVESVVQLFNEGNTVPFIARYRKETWAGWTRTPCAANPVAPQLRQTSFNDRKQTILKSAEFYGRLTGKSCAVKSRPP